MILYHGSNVEIDKISLEKCRPYKDFGKGFYLTTIEEQAFKMANRVAKIYKGKPCVTIFEISDNLFELDSLIIRFFEKPTKDWAIFVINNRNREFKDITNLECNHDNKYDVVSGPIANDDLALLFRQFSNRLIDVNILVKEMEYKKLTNQYSFHTETALTYLKKVGVKYE